MSDTVDVANAPIPDHDKIMKVCQLMIDETTADAMKLDGTPFTGKAVATVLGEMMATIVALAEMCGFQQRQIDELRRRR